ncbi:MAG TPA: MerR family transcriptional regulator [Aquirhabdus sp.]
MKTITIGKLAKTAQVGIETIRYYQSRGLLPIPDNMTGYRQYPLDLVDRIQHPTRSLGHFAEFVSDSPSVPPRQLNRLNFFKNLESSIDGVRHITLQTKRFIKSIPKNIDF